MTSPVIQEHRPLSAQGHGQSKAFYHGDNKAKVTSFMHNINDDNNKMTITVGIYFNMRAVGLMFSYFIQSVIR